ncbi:hypothetical protein CFD26_104550 [Aspergillus turcosus]|uniref:Uncharacterized protein n=1 Tax=Aspergillus turcosus TaxID=1245748 RepID=A0A421CZC9_9EURO|nr:hypothetical protein CFD26_104550 [Aspergillus turcosus]
MASSPVDLAKERVSLRDKYKLTARSIVQALESQSKPAYTHTELTQLRVSLQSFNPEDQKFIDSEACLFEPLTREELEEFTIDKTELPEDDHHHFCEFKETFNEFAPYEVSEDCRMWERACQILEYLNIVQCYYEKKGDKKDGGEDTFSMEYLSHWHHIKAEDSFHDGPQGMLYGLRIGHLKPSDLPRWNAESICQWRDDLEDPKTTRAHIKLVTCTGAEAKEDELLHGELGPIANAIQCRLAQPEFEQTSLFPVLVISLFGPRHGRLLQAKFDNSGTLNIRSSPIYNFVDNDEKMKLLQWDVEWTDKRHGTHGTLKYLLRNPEKMGKLQREIRGSLRSADEALSI